MTVQIEITAGEFYGFLNREIKRIRRVVAETEAIKIETKVVKYRPFWPFGKRTVIVTKSPPLPWSCYGLESLEERLVGVGGIREDAQIVADESDLLNINYGQKDEVQQ